MDIKHGEWLTQRTPTITGAIGRAWKIEAKPEKKDHEATVAGYLLYAPGFHPFWAYWMFGCVHLRPMEGVKPAVKRHDDVTHELMIISLDPNHAPPDPIGWGSMHYLEPFDVVEQFTVPSDEAAALLTELCVRACCDGIRSPDSDFRAQWQDTIQKTAAHARGEHAAPR